MREYRSYTYQAKHHFPVMPRKRVNGIKNLDRSSLTMLNEMLGLVLKQIETNDDACYGKY